MVDFIQLPLCWKLYLQECIPMKTFEMRKAQSDLENIEKMPRIEDTYMIYTSMSFFSRAGISCACCLEVL